MYQIGYFLPAAVRDSVMGTATGSVLRVSLVLVVFWVALVTGAQVLGPLPGPLAGLRGALWAAIPPMSVALAVAWVYDRR